MFDLNDNDFISRLPDEIIFYILSLLPARDVLKSQVLNKRIRRVALDDDLWKQYLKPSDRLPHSNQANYFHLLSALQKKLGVKLSDPTLMTLTINENLTNDEAIFLGIFLFFCTNIQKVEFKEVSVQNPNPLYHREINITPIESAKYGDVFTACLTKNNPPILTITEANWPVIKDLMPYISSELVFLKLQREASINEFFEFFNKSKIKKIFLSSYVETAYSAGDSKNSIANRFILNALARTDIDRSLSLNLQGAIDQDVVNALQSCLLPRAKQKPKIIEIEYNLEQNDVNVLPILFNAFKYSSLRVIKFSENKLSRENLNLLIGSLPDSLRVLDLSYNRLTDHLFKQLMRNLPLNLRELYLKGVGLESLEGLEYLKGRSLRRLSLARNGIQSFTVNRETLYSQGINDVAVIVDLLRDPNCQLEELDLGECHTIKTGISEIVELLKNNIHLKFVSLYGIGGGEIANALHKRLSEIMVYNLYICNPPMWRGLDIKLELVQRKIETCAKRNEYLSKARGLIALADETSDLNRVYELLEVAKEQINLAKSINAPFEKTDNEAFTKCVDHCNILSKQIETIHNQKFQPEKHSAATCIQALFRGHNARQKLKHTKEAKTYFSELENQQLVSAKFLQQKDYTGLARFAKALEASDYLTLYKMIPDEVVNDVLTKKLVKQSSC